LLLDKTFRDGFAALASLSLAFDAWMFQTQLSDLVDLLRAFPQTTSVPLGEVTSRRIMT
jgi:L-fuconolactonase